MLTELGEDEAVAAPTILFGDNVQANNLSRDHFVSTGNQCIYLPYHLSREATELGIIEVKWVRTIHNLADLMTKAMSAQKMKGLLGYLLGYEPAENYMAMLMTILDEAANKAQQSKH